MMRHRTLGLNDSFFGTAVPLLELSQPLCCQFANSRITIVLRQGLQQSSALGVPASSQSPRSAAPLDGI